MKQKIAIVISVYNEASSLPGFCASICKELALLDGYDFELIWVNDGSADDSQHVIDQLALEQQAANLQHRSIQFSKNFGHEAAMIAGIDQAEAAAIICLDADGQHPASEISKMLQAFEQGNDFVLMSRTKREDNSVLKNLLSSIFYRLINSLSEISFKQNSSDFFLISDQVAEVLRENYREKNRFIRGFIQSLGFVGTTLEYVAPKREHGESNYNYYKLFKLAISAIFTFSFKPLRISILIALLFIALTLVLTIFSLYQYAYGNKPPSGYTTLIIFMAFSFALLFSLLSIQLLYFEKLIEEIRNSPIYIIKQNKLYERKA